MYIKDYKLKRFKQYELLKFFCSSTPASTASDLIGIHHNSANKFYHRLLRDCQNIVKSRSVTFLYVEVDENYFGGHRKEKRGKDAHEKSLYIFF